MLGAAEVEGEEYVTKEGKSGFRKVGSKLGLGDTGGLHGSAVGGSGVPGGRSGVPGGGGDGGWEAMEAVGARPGGGQGRGFKKGQEGRKEGGIRQDGGV